MNCLIQINNNNNYVYLMKRPLVTDAIQRRRTIDIYITVIPQSGKATWNRCVLERI